MNNNNNNINTQWVQWLVGLMDAEGNFQVFPKKRTNTASVITSYSIGIGIHIGMHIRELPMILDIQARLGGIGNVYQYPDKKEVHFALASRDDIKRFILLVLTEHALLTSHQQQRFALLNHVIQNDLRKVATREEYDALVATSFKGPVLTGLSQEFISNWLVGFINGEGSFYTPEGGSVFTFAVEHTDKPVLELLRKTLGLSLKVYDRQQRGTRKLTYVVQVSNLSDINRVVKFLDSSVTMQGHKLVQYNEWRDKWLVKTTDK